MKQFILAFLVLVSFHHTSAFALNEQGLRGDSILLSKSISSGFAPPEYSTWLQCDVMASAVHRQGKMRRQTFDSTTPVKFTEEVPSVEAISALLLEAAKTETVRTNHPLPMDAGTAQYLGFVPTDSIQSNSLKLVLKTMIGFSVRDINPSAAADVLNRFLDLNCALDSGPVSTPSVSGNNRS